jgi:hypothetical protein
MADQENGARDDRDFMAPADGPAQFAARVRTLPGNVWFTAGQGWAFEADGQTNYSIRLTMVPTQWDGELLLVPIPDAADQTNTQD